MKNRHRHIGIYLAESLLLLICIIGIIAFSRFSSSLFDILFLLSWGAVLLILTPLLIRGELKLRHAEALSGSILGGGSQDGA